MAYIEVFREVLERHVQAELSRGAVISSDDADATCPLGCVPGALNRRPFAGQVPQLAGEEEAERIAFAVAFDGLKVAPEFEGPFAELGREYRQRFP